METSAAAAISATVVWSYPCSPNSRMAALISACRVRRRLRSRNPTWSAKPTSLQAVFTLNRRFYSIEKLPSGSQEGRAKAAGSSWPWARRRGPGLAFESADAVWGVNPLTTREPGGTIELADARYTAFDERIVRVEGSRFEPASQYTVKLEGAAITGYETVSFARIRDPLILVWL